MRRSLCLTVLAAVLGLTVLAPWAQGQEKTDGPKAPPTSAQLRDWTARLGHRSCTVRRQAARDLFNGGERALPMLDEAANRAKTPGVRREAARLADGIRRGIHPDRPDIAQLLLGYDRRPFLDRLAVVARLEKLCDPEAFAALSAIVRRDRSPSVRAYAQGAVVRVRRRLGGGTRAAITVLNTQGCACLRAKKYKEALAIFDKMLAVDANNDTALYNKACAYALMGDKDKAFHFLEKAVKAGYADGEHMDNDDDFDSLRDDPRYKRIQRMIGR